MEVEVMAEDTVAEAPHNSTSLSFLHLIQFSITFQHPNLFPSTFHLTAGEDMVEATDCQEEVTEAVVVLTEVMESVNPADTEHTQVLKKSYAL